MDALDTVSIMDSWHSYPSIFALGHKALAGFLADPVLVEEKVDGSQFSFGRFDGELRCRSKGAQLNLVAPERMFLAGVEAVSKLDLHDGWTYRGEYLQKPKHNVLAYDRTPPNHVVLYDINTGHEQYMSYDEKVAEAARLGLEVVPRLFEGIVTDVTMFRTLLDNTSCLGGQKIEGVVVKNYQKFGPDKKVLMGKFVSEAFKEVHAGEWRAANPTQGDIVQVLIDRYKTPARWHKAMQHLTERGELEGTPKDIGKLMKEVPDDILKECEDEIKQQLFDWAFSKVRRGVCGGLPEWYKEQLLAKQFEQVA